jgi:HK97 family phage portal protein
MRSPLGAVLDRTLRPRAAAAPPVPFVGTRGLRYRGLGRGNDRSNQVNTYAENGTLFSIVSLYAQATATVRWHLYRKSNTDHRLEDRTEVFSHLALDLWNRPNDFYTGQLFRETFQQHLDLTGEAWWVIERNPAMRSIPLGMWPVRPDRMLPVPSREKYLAGYLYLGPDGEQIPLALDEVIQLRMPNPADPYRGLGPVQALLTDLDSARYSAEWNRNFFVNGAEPGGVISVDRRLADDEFDEMTSRWREQHQGVANAHRVAILEQGATWQDRTYSQRDMQFAELRNLSRDVIREAFRMHGHMLGQAEDINLANAKAADYTFAKWGVDPRADRIRDTLNFAYLPLFGTTGEGVEFDYETVVPADQETDNQTLTARAAAAAALRAAGWDAAGVLDAVGLPPIPYTATPAPAVPQARAGGASWRPRA